MGMSAAIFDARPVQRRIRAGRGPRNGGPPVKWTSDRQEYFVADHQARDLAVTAELALDREGRFLAMRGSNLVNQGAYALAFGPLNKGVEIMSSIYDVRAVHFRGRAALTNTIPTRPYRSSGRPEVMFVMERLIDLAALETRIDRIELRRRNLVPESMMPYTNPFGMVYDSGAYHRVMERVLSLADWSGFPARREEARRYGKCRGIGLANYVDTATGAPREKAEVTVKPEGPVGGTVEVVIGTTSQGQGHETSFAQLMTEWLGVPIDSIKLVTGDTDRVSVGGGAHSGRALRLGSIVMFNSSNQIIEKGLKIASHVLEAAVEDIAFAGGRFEVKGTDRAIGIFEVARATLGRTDLPEDLRGPLQGTSDETVNLAAFPYGCHVCEVEIDADTGVVEIVRYTAVDDCGRAVNPMIVHGQVHGGIVQGVGQAFGTMHHEPARQVLSGSFMDYACENDMVPFFDNRSAGVRADPSARHPAGRRRRTTGARRGDQRGRRCAAEFRRHPYRNAGDRRSGAINASPRGTEDAEKKTSKFSVISVPLWLNRFQVPGREKFMARIRHIALTTKEPAKVAEFYKSAFGLKELRRSPTDRYS